MIQQKRHVEKRLVSLKAKKMARNISSQSVAAFKFLQEPKYSHILESKEEKKK